MKLTAGQAPPKPKLTEPPGIPCEMTSDLLELLKAPDLVTASKAAIHCRDEQKERAPGLHVSDLGYAEGMCKRQLWLRENGPDLIPSRGGPPAHVYDAPLDWPKRFGFWRGHETEDAFVQLWLEALGDWHIERHLAASLVHTSGRVFTGELDVMLTQPPRQVICDVKEVDDNKLARLDAPRPSNVAQLQGYMYAHEADYGILFYSARWSVPKQFYVPRDDVATQKRMQTVIEVVQSPEPPEVLEPRVDKGPELKDESRSIKLGLPWQCETTVNGYTHRCPFLDHGCDGALQKSCRGNGMWGHLRKDNTFKVKPGMEETVSAFGEERLAELLVGKEA